MYRSRLNDTPGRTSYLARLNDKNLLHVFEKTGRPFVLVFESRNDPNLSRMVNRLYGILERLGDSISAGICMVEDAPVESKRLGIRGVPTVLAIAQGKVIGERIGLLSQDELLELAQEGFSSDSLRSCNVAEDERVTQSPGDSDI